MYFIYSLILTLFSPLFLFKLYSKKAGKPKFGHRWKEHFGFTPKLKNTTSQPTWIHAVSVGEVIAISPLIKKLKNEQPEINIVLTTTTSTGANEAKKLGKLITHRYMPLDFGFAIKGFIKKLKPDSLFIMETELWPNTLYYCQKNNIPVTIINARLSQRSALRYKKFPFIFNLLLKNINNVLAQTQQDAQRFIDLGISPTNVVVTGSIKFDISVTHNQLLDAKELRKQLGQQRKVWIAASTHKGEDEQLIDAHKELLKNVPDSLLILVPRHPERFIPVSKLITLSKLEMVTRSSKKSVSSTTQIYLGDSMGEMMVLLGAADICFIAGSLIGDKVGGHNLLEAAALEKPILNGPSFFNFKEITEQLATIGACTICEDSSAIQKALTLLFNDKQKAELQGKIAFEFVKKNQGALRSTVDNMLRLTKSGKL